MKTYMPLNGLRWSRNSGSANCDMPQSAVFGRPGGGTTGILIVRRGAWSSTTHLPSSAKIYFVLCPIHGKKFLLMDFNGIISIRLD